MGTNHKTNKKRLFGKQGGVRADRKGVLICGAYGMGNSGDDAILEGILAQLRSIDASLEITVLSRSPRETRERFGVQSFHMFNILWFCHRVKQTKLFISGGGSLIQNITSRRSLWYYLYTIRTAKKLGANVMMYGCGIGPIVRRQDEGRITRALNECVDVITLREERSLLELERLAVSRPRIAVSSDPAWGVPPAGDEEVDAFLKENGLDPQGRYICFCLREWKTVPSKAQLLASAADYAARELKLTPVFVLINPRQDGEITQTVRSLMKEKSALISRKGSTAAIIGVISRMKTVVSMRLHGLIFAASGDVPVVGICFDPKVEAFFDLVGERRCVSLEEMDLQGLCEMIKSAAETPETEKNGNRIIERLKVGTKLNIELARELLEN